MAEKDGAREGLRRAQRAEAVRRLELLEGRGLHGSVRAGFEREGRVCYSERTPLGFSAMGELRRMDGPSAVSWSGRPFSEVVADFEGRSGALVYHATHEVLAFGELLDLFYVTERADEWPQDKVDLSEGYAFVLSVNFSNGMLSDLMTIEFSVVGGGLVRTA